MVVLDIPDSGAYYVFDGDNVNPKPHKCSNPEHSTHNSAHNSKLKTLTPNQVTTENISLFIEDYDEERLERKELQEDEEEGEEGQ